MDLVEAASAQIDRCQAFLTWGICTLIPTPHLGHSSETGYAKAQQAIGQLDNCRGGSGELQLLHLPSSGADHLSLSGGHWIFWRSCAVAGV